MKNLLNHDLVIIVSVTSLCCISVCLLEPVLPIYLTSIGASTAITGLLFAVIVAGMVIGETWGGWIGDKAGPKMPLIAGTFICACAVFALIFVNNIPGIFWIFLFWGILRATIWGPARGYVGNASDLKNKAIFMAIFSTILAVDRSLASLASGFIADNWGYHWNFLISAGILILAGSVVVFGLRKTPFKLPRKNPAEIKFDPSFPQNPGINYRIFIPQCVIVGLSWLSLGIISVFLPILGSQEIGLSSTQVGILFTIGAITSAALLIPFGKLADIIKKKYLIGFGLALISLSFIGLAFSRSYTLLIVFTIIYNIGSAMFTPSALAFLSMNIPTHRQSSAFGIYGAAEDIGFIVGSSAGGFFWNIWGPSSTFLAGAIAGIIGAAMGFYFARENRSKAEL
jgi:MFS family permease